LGYVVDWGKLCKYLHDTWQCDGIFFYPGIEVGDTKMAQEFESLSKDGCVVRAKTIIVYKNPDKTIPTKCTGCGREGVVVVPMGYRKKANCDVELTVDALELAGADTDFMIFSGDGDFGYLIETIIQRGGTVKIVSNAKKWTDPAGHVRSRFAKKLRVMIAANPKTLTMLDLARWRDIIKKEIA
jgi:uncharacterized LabA/DUF88 family protein